jgi:VanZ family protein
MATSPAILNPSLELPKIHKAWLPVFFSLAFICFTSSTLMSGYHTQFVVNDVWKALFGSWHLNDWTGVVNGEGRKIGHFFGYGAIGLVFRNAWQHTLRTRAIQLGRTLLHSRLMILSALLSVGSIFLVASADELHQCFLPQRVGSFGDVLRDTSGTVFMNLLLLAYRAYKRPAAAYAWYSNTYSAAETPSAAE